MATSVHVGLKMTLGDGLNPKTLSILFRASMHGPAKSSFCNCNTPSLGTYVHLHVLGSLEPLSTAWRRARAS